MSPVYIVLHCNMLSAQYWIRRKVILIKTEGVPDMSFIVFVFLFTVVCGWLDSRLPIDKERVK